MNYLPTRRSLFPAQEDTQQAKSNPSLQNPTKRSDVVFLQFRNICNKQKKQSVFPRAERIFQPSATGSEEEEKITKPPSQGRAQINQQGNFGRAQINPPRQLWVRPFQSARQLWAPPINQ
jgi:hypothetical protein